MRSRAAIGTPVDFAKMAYRAPTRALARVTGGRLVHGATPAGRAASG